MKKIFAVTVLCLFVNEVFSQAVPKNVVLEHFTNTYCSPCATRNPGLYANLADHPSVYHVAYHPSAPYQSCTLYQHNPTDNDARTNFYGVYGSTPRIALQGVALPNLTQFTDTTIFDNALGQFSSFQVTTELTLQNSSTIRVKTTILKVDTSSLTQADLYGAIIEDTLDFTSNNGEPHHYDVFRGGVWGAGVTNISLPTMINTSVSMMQDITVHNDWDLGKVYALVMLHADDKTLIQASKSNDLSIQLSVPMEKVGHQLCIAPNPANSDITISGMIPGNIIVISDLQGKMLLKQVVGSTSEQVDISAFSPGFYILSVLSGIKTGNFKFVKL